MSDATPPNATERSKARATTALGWMTGALMGLSVDYALYEAIGDAWLGISTFILFVGGAFAGMAVAEKLGPKAFRPLGIAAGVMLALALTFGVTVWMMAH